MFVLIICPECGKSMKVVETALGSDATCPACGHVFPTVAEPIEEPIDAEEVSEAEVLDEEGVDLAEAEDVSHARHVGPGEHPRHTDDDEVSHAHHAGPGQHADEEEVFHADAVPVEHAEHGEEEVFHAEAVPVDPSAQGEELSVEEDEAEQDAEYVAPVEDLLHPEDALSDDDMDDYPPRRPALAPRPRGKRSAVPLIGIVLAAIVAAGGAAVYFRQGADVPPGPAPQPPTPVAQGDKAATPVDGSKKTIPEPVPADTPPDSLEALKKMGLTVEEKDGKIVGASTNEKFTDATLPYLVKHLGEVEGLTLQSRISDEGLRHVAGLKNLRRLDLGGDLGGKERLNGSGLADLKELTNLEEIDLGKTGVTDAALGHLQGLANLRSLNLGQTGITDAGLVHLQGLRSLRKLSLAETRVTDAGLVYLKKLRSLEELLLPQTAVDGSGLANLRFCNKLKTLDLSETRVSDAALANLQLLKGLETLRLDKTEVTKQGSAKLKKALPKARID